jgi:hypothetical protein
MSIRSWILSCLLLILIALSGCGGGELAPISRNKMLVVGAGASSPVLTELRKSLGEDRYSGAQDPSKYSLVVVEGRSVAPQQLEQSTVVKSALAKGVSVMFLNMTEGHKKALVTGKTLPLHTSGDSAAYMVTPLGGSSRRLHITNLRAARVSKTGVRHEHTPSGLLQGQYTTSFTDLPIAGDHLALYMGEVSKRLGEQGRSTIAPPTPPSDYPSTSWFQVAVTDTWSTGSDPSLDGQSLAHDITYNFYCYYDNGASLSSHDAQWVAMSMEGTATPSSPVHDDEDHRGWQQVRFLADFQPVDTQAGNGLQLALVNAQPTNANGSLSSSMEFNIGYAGSGGNTAWLWQQTLNQSPASFGGWSGTSPPPAQGDINDVALQLMQTSPFNGDGSNWTDGFYTVFVGKHAHGMNGVSTNPLDVVGQALWKTQAPFNGVVQIQCSSVSQMTYIYVNNGFEYHEHYESYDIGAGPLTVNLDLSQIQAPGAS